MIILIRNGFKERLLAVGSHKCQNPTDLHFLLCHRQLMHKGFFLQNPHSMHQRSLHLDAPNKEFIPFFVIDIHILWQQKLLSNYTQINSKKWRIKIERVNNKKKNHHLFVIDWKATG